MKINFKKIAIGVASLLVILVAFVSINLITNKKNRTTEYDSNKLFPVKILFADKDKVPKDVTLDDFFFKYDYADALIYAMSSDLPLIDKEDNYYVLDLKKYINHEVLNNLTAETFAKYNLNGETVTDIKYDKNTKILKIPTSYYDENDKENTQIRVQAEFIDVTSKVDLQNVKVKLKTTNFLSSNRTIKLNGISTVTSFSIAKYNNKKNLTKSDLDIYINNSKDKLPKDNFEYDSKTGVVSFNYPSVFVNSIDVDVNSNNLFTRFLCKVFNIESAGAIKNTANGYAIKLSKAPTIPSRFLNGEYIRTYNDPSSSSSYYSNSGFETHYIFDYTYSKAGGSGVCDPYNNHDCKIDPMFYNGRGIPWSYPAINSNRNPYYYSYNGALSDITSGNASNQYGALADQVGTYHAVKIGSNLNYYDDLKIEFEDNDLWLNLDCIHIDQSVSTPNSDYYIAYNIKIIDYDASGQNITLAILSQNSSGDQYPGFSDGGQAAWGVYTFYWTDELKYIELQKDYSPSLSDAEQDRLNQGVVFTAYKNPQYTGTSYTSTYDSTNNKFYIGKDSQGHGTLGSGTYYIKETTIPDGYRVEFPHGNSVTISGVYDSTQTSTTPIYFGDDTIVQKCLSDNPSASTSDCTNEAFGLHNGGGTNGLYLAKNGAKLAITDYEENEVDKLYLNFDNKSVFENIKNGTPIVISIGKEDLKYFNQYRDQRYCKYNNPSDCTSIGNPEDYYLEIFKNRINSQMKSWKSLGASKVYISKIPNNEPEGSLKTTIDVFNTKLSSTAFSSILPVEIVNDLDNIIGTLPDSDFSSNSSSSVTFTATNKKIEYCIKITKQDGESPDNNPTYLSGVEFGVYSDSSCSTLITSASTNSSGFVKFSNLPAQNVWFKELNAKNGYHNNNGDCKPAIGTDINDGNACNDYLVNDYKKYYCIKIDKKNTSSEMLSGAVFKATSSTSPSTTFTSTETSAGHYSIFVEDHSEQFNITETTAPDGYAPVDSFNVTPFSLSSGSKTKAQAKALCEGSSTKDSSGDTPTPVSKVDKKLLLNWYKVTEDGTTRANGAKFKIKQKEGTKYIKVNGTETVTDTSNPSITKKCYKFHSLVDSESAASTLTSNDISEAQDGSMKGEVCISGIPKGTYTVIETKPAEYHTFGTYKTRDFTISNDSTVFKQMTNDNKYINLPTEFEFDKYVTSGDDADWSSITTEMLKLIEFNVYDADGNLVEFIKLPDGTYVYAGNDIDGTSGTRVTGLYLGDDRKIHIKHLPTGTYSIKEKIDNNNGTCDCTLDGSCIGFFGPTYETESDYKFTITDCSNDNATACSSYSITIQSLNNTPTEIKFTKSDLYSYEDASDIVDFENDQERNDFDRIVFKLKDENGNYLRLVKVRNVGTCLTDDSYAEYRYVPEDMIDSLTEEQRANLTEELYTCGGHIHITHLCRGKKYYIEEVSVPENSVFTLPESVEARTREYTIPCCGEGSSTTTTAIIEDTPTRVRFEKRDSKYNYLIPDETTTFQVYQCKKGTTCHPADGITSDMKLIKFSPRAVIDGDREDPTDVAGLEGVEVYKAMSDSDVAAGKEFVTDLHPYHGILVLRYLSSGYNYVLLETKAPKNYTLPSGRAAETSFTVVNNTVNVDVTDMPNTPTGLIIRKYSDDGRLLTGARFKIYEGTTCDSHLTPMNQPKRELKVKTIRDGLYEARPVEDTNVIETCNNKNGICSSIPVDQVTSLTYTTYLGTWADFDNAINDRQEKVQLQEGEALIQYLEYGHCYIIEEIKAPDGYSLPKNAEDRFTMVTLDENERYIKDTYKTLVNTPTPFTFYKYDEYNQLLDGAEFKLQKLDNNKIYQDVTVTQVEKNGELYYKVDENSTNKTITTRGGKATIYYLSTGQYRVLETKAAPGKELSKNPNIATFFVDDSGNVYGDGIIINKAKTEKIEVKSSSSAEYIVGINTGQQVIRYGLIVAVLILGITGLIILNKKSK